MQTTIQDCPVWITYLNQFDCDDQNKAEGLRETSGDTMYEPGYYWASCFPGCIPDSEFFGPFASESEAESHAEEHLSY
jgi:hypothetical protein